MRKLTPILILIFVLSLHSCNSFLDKTPDNRATLDRPEAVAELLVSAYPDQTYQVFTESMSDNVADRGPQANELASSSPSKLMSEQAYNWTNIKGDDQDTPTAYWTSCYNAIAACNHALEAISLNGDGPDYAAQKGEALICRAYAHFMLVNIFAEHYDPNTAQTALGVPYVTKPEKVVFQDYKRATVAEVYSQIKADFNAGYPLINDTKYDTKKSWHFTKTAASAFAARMYLYLNEPDSVIKYSNIVLGSTPQSLLRDWNGAYQNLASSDAIGTQYNKSEESCNLLIIGCVSWLNRAIYNRYGLDFNLMNNMARKTNVSGGKNSFQFFGWSSANGVFIPKFYEYFKRESINANYGIGYVMAPVFTAEEVLLNRAEAYVMKNDYASCLKDINTYYTKRVVGYSAVTNTVTDTKVTAFTAADATSPAPFYAINATQLPYIKLLLDMRRAEFIHEGLRWFDIKRMHLAVKHDFYNQPTASITLSPNDLRRAVQIPIDAQTFGIIPNPRDAAPTPSIIKPTE